MTWHKTCELVDKYVVKIQTPQGEGTGFFFAYNETKKVIAIATALHVVDEVHNWRLPIKIVPEKNREEIYLPYENRVILVDPKRDTAAILFATDKMKEPPEKMLGIVSKEKFVRRGVELGWCGYPSIAPKTLCFFQGRVSAFDESDDSYFLDGVAINGVSGGPVFDESLESVETKIVGLVSAYIANRQQSGTLPGLLVAYDVTHLHAVVEEIKNIDEARKKEIEAKAQVQKSGGSDVVSEEGKGDAEPTK